MQSTDANEHPTTNGKKADIVASAVLGALLATVPSWLIAKFHSLEMAIGLGMLLIPFFGFVGWASGSVKALMATLGGIAYTLGVASIKNATGLPNSKDALHAEIRSEAERSRQQSQATSDRIHTAETDDELVEIVSHIERRRQFIRGRRIVLLSATILACIVGGLIILDWMNLRNGGDTLVVPSTWKAIEFENLVLIFPVLFVLAAVPLAVCFANYSIRYLALCLFLSIYAGTAFYLVFHANRPNLQIWLPPSIIFFITSGVGLLAEWVTLEEVAAIQPSDSDSSQANADFDDQTGTDLRH